MQFYAPESAFAEACEHLPRILLKRSIPVNEGLGVLDALKKIVQPVAIEALSAFEQTARERMRGRDEEDWPVLAAAIALNCAIWTEDTDFFGSGAATWTTDRVEMFLLNAARVQSTEQDDKS